ncbi:MAG: hypothetical protein WKG01_36100 [Kofleriaceae bacterium]
MRDDTNLTSGERGQRLRTAMIFLGVTITLVLLLAELAVAPAWWLVLGVPLFVASMQLVQAYTGVCVFHARHGTRTCAVSGDAEPILDPRKRQCVQARAKGVLATAIGLAMSATTLVVVLAYAR